LRASVFSAAGALTGLALALSGCASATSDTGPTQMAATAAPSLQITDTKAGTGFTPKPGQLCVVHYTGWIYENGVKGKKFDSSVDRKRPFAFVLGNHQVIEGWEKGVETMKTGGKRTLIIPPALAYGAAGQGATIPPNATLLFEVELLEVKAST
jgi:peptidylprolyl isomerase